MLIDLMRTPDTVERDRFERLGPDGRDALAALAHQHRCAPYLAYALDRRGDVDMPDSLRVIRDRSVFQALKIGRECVQIHEMFVDAGIAHVFLKGVPLAFRDYPASWMRPMRDIDVLIEPERLHDAYALLHDKGGSLDRFAHVPPDIVEDGKHLPPIHSPNRILPVELHYRMISPKVSLPSTVLQSIEQDVWEARNVVHVGKAELPVPRTELLLAHLIVHGMLDHELNNGPLFITDIVQFMRSNQLDRAKWDRVVERFHLRPAVELAASILPPNERSGLGVKAPARGMLDDEMVRALMFQPARFRSQIKVLASLSDEAVADRALLVWSKIFASRTALKGQWLVEGNEPGKEPRNTAVFWLWYLSVKIRQFFRTRTAGEELALQSLRGFRAKLTHHSREN
ncbi:nucleotidyltransferase family protein [Pelagerythrobacter sp.]|uniref:nucleotidyltransferase family protein n=1 Tax=Pelagerythrobacter sp. TaxID=2800702 RepID=UPI0035AF92A2